MSSQSSSHITEAFSIEFDGPATQRHEMSAAALAQSLLAMDALARRSAESVYGAGSEIEIKVKANPRPGSFIVDMVILAAPIVGAAASAVTVIKGLISLGRWARGKGVTKMDVPLQDGRVTLQNVHGENITINANTYNIYTRGSTQAQLSRITQTLDLDGIEHVAITDSEGHREVVTRAERPYFRREEGVVLTDNTTEAVLEVIGGMFNGSSKGWRFYEGDGGLEFSADVLDESFLEKVKNGDYHFAAGTIMHVILRTVQRRTTRTITERTVLEVNYVHPSLETI